MSEEWTREDGREKVEILEVEVDVKDEPLLSIGEDVVRLSRPIGAEKRPSVEPEGFVLIIRYFRGINSTRKRADDAEKIEKVLGAYDFNMRKNEEGDVLCLVLYFGKGYDIHIY